MNIAIKTPIKSDGDLDDDGSPTYKGPTNQFINKTPKIPPRRNRNKETGLPRKK